jgi:hypothetical protein
VPPQPEPPLGIRNELHPGAPAEPVLVTGHWLDLDGPIHLREPLQLFGDDRSLEPALGRQARVLPVAPAAPAGPREGARRLDPVGRRAQDFDGICPEEPVAFTTLRHDRDDALARERMTDEDDARFMARNTVPAVRDGADVELEPRPDEGCPLAVGRQRSSLPPPC